MVVVLVVVVISSRLVDKKSRFTKAGHAGANITWCIGVRSGTRGAN